MAARFATTHRPRACAVVALMALSLAAAMAEPARPGSPSQLPAEIRAPASPQIAAFEPYQQALDHLSAMARQEGLTDQAFADLQRELQRVRDELNGEIAKLEPRLAEVEARLNQLGPPPTAGASPEDATITSERERLTRFRAGVDSGLKQGRLLALQADHLAERISERRRFVFARELFKRTGSVLDAAFWHDAAVAAHDEIGSVRDLLQSWWNHARDVGGVRGAAGALLTLAAFAVGATSVRRWGRARWPRTPAIETRFARARVALARLVRHAVLMPAAVAAFVLVLDACGLLPPSMLGLGLGFAVAVTVACFGRAVAIALLAPGEDARRLVALSDATARPLAAAFAWGACVLGATIFLNLVHKTVDAPLVLTVATNALAAIVVAALLVNLLVRLRRNARLAETRNPRAQWLRAAGWLIVAVIAVALVTGTIGLAAFIAGRLLTVLAVLGALYIAVVFVDALFDEVLTADSEHGRGVAAWLGLSPRGVELVGTLLSAAIRVLLVIVAAYPLLGPWGLFAADFFDVIGGALFGFRFAGLAVSFTAIFGAFAVLLVGVLATRALQRWLERSVLPRAGLDPGLQHSVSALVGYAGLIAVIALALAELGIDLQKIALVAGALSVGIGFGLQSVVSNFVSGLILLAERPIRVGDMIVVKGEEGYVRKISVRATEIETFERASVIIPNSELITGVVKNWTHLNPTGRITVKVRVTYASDPDQVRDILKEAAAEHPQVLQTPAPRILLIALGDSALEFELRCVVANVDYALLVKSDLHFAILRRFRSARIAIPFPPHEERVLGGQS